MVIQHILKTSWTGRTILAALSLAFLSAGAKAVTVDDYSAGFTTTNNGWRGSGQTLTVPGVDNTLDYIRVYADPEANGQSFDVRVLDGLNGSVLFSSLNQGISTGANTFNIGQAFTPGSTIHVTFDYNGYSSASLQYQGNVYAGGHSTFFQTTFDNQDVYSSLDHRFLAQWSEGGQRVPDGGASVALLGLSLVGLTRLRKKLMS